MSHFQCFPPTMSEKTFQHFLKANAGVKENEPKVDWNRTREEWLIALGELFEQVKGFLSKYEEVKIDEEPIQLAESQLGTYQVSRLVLKVRGLKATLTPVGTIIVGGKGRVDLAGMKGTMRFVLVNEHAVSPAFGFSLKIGDKVIEEGVHHGVPEGGFVWKIATPPPKIRYGPLNADTFFDALLTVIGGE